MEQELLTLPEHLSSPPGFSGVRVVRSLVFCVVFCRSLFVLLFFFFFFVIEPGDKSRRSNFSSNPHIFCPGGHVNFPISTKTTNAIEVNPMKIPAKFGNINEFTFFSFFLSPDEMLCTINISVFSLVNSFHIMFSGEV
jgi:hypothetical protein